MSSDIVMCRHRVITNKKTGGNEMRKEIEQLLASNLTTNRIATESGVSQSVVHRLRSGERTIGKLSIESGEKLKKYWETINMIKLTALDHGDIQSQETFKKFDDLKQHLLTIDYFTWIKDEEPDKELPDFTNAETLEDVQVILDEYDYSWWRLTTEDVNIWIKWTGKTTDGNKKYTAEGSTYEEVYNHINEKYGYGSILDDEEENRTDWTEEDYRNAIEESTSEAYYHEFKLTVE